MKKFVFVLFVLLSGCSIPDETEFLKENQWKCPNSAVLSFDGTSVTSVIRSANGTQTFTSSYSIRKVANGEFDLNFAKAEIMSSVWGGLPTKSVVLSRQSGEGFLLRSGGREDLCVR